MFPKINRMFPKKVVPAWSRKYNRSILQLSLTLTSEIIHTLNSQNKWISKPTLEMLFIVILAKTKS